MEKKKSVRIREKIPLNKRKRAPVAYVFTFFNTVDSVIYYLLLPERVILTLIKQM